MSEVKEKEKISLQSILDMLAAGKTRKEIAKEIGISYNAAQKGIFNHPKLQNRKTRPVADFELVDDAPDAPVAKPKVVAEEVVAVADAPATEEVAETIAETATEEVAQGQGEAGAWRE